MDSFGSAERGSRLSNSYHRQQMRLPAIPQELKKTKTILMILRRVFCIIERRFSTDEEKKCGNAIKNLRNLLSFTERR